MPDRTQDWHVKITKKYTDSHWWPIKHYWVWDATTTLGMPIRRNGDVYFTRRGAKYAAKRDLRRMFKPKKREARSIEFDLHL